MKYVVILAVAFAIAVGALSYAWSVKDSPMPPQLEREVKTRSDEPSLLPDLVEVTTREAVAEEPSPTAEPRSPLEIFLAANPGSPLGLLPPEEAAKYLATRENLVAWVESVDELDDIDVDAIEWTDDLQFLWGVCQEHMALRTYILHYQDRERERWQNREQSVSLEAELGSVRQFMDRQLGQDREVWRLISLYSDEVAAEIRNDGENAADGYDPASRWVLFSALSDAGAPLFYASVEILRNSK